MKENFRYKKEMGQNFIFDLHLLEELADASLVGADDNVLEIGSGRGLFTAALAKRCRKVIGVELDRTLLPDLRVNMSLFSNVDIIQGDILALDLQALFQMLGSPCRVAANIPYNITTPLLNKLLLSHLPFESIAVMVQKEVGEKLMATTGQAGYGPLALTVQYFAEAKEVLRVPAECFTPKPKVDSSFMLLTLLKSPAVIVHSEAMLWKTISAAFAMRRKTLVNNLLHSGLMRQKDQIEAILIANTLSPTVRAEQLTLMKFADITNAIYLHKQQNTQR